jgi:hypothetical protein
VNEAFRNDRGQLDAGDLPPPSHVQTNHGSLNYSGQGSTAITSDQQLEDGVLLDFWWPAGSLDWLSSLPDDFERTTSGPPPGT